MHTLAPMHLAVAFELLDELRLQGDFPHSMLGVCHTVVAVSLPRWPAGQPALLFNCPCSAAEPSPPCLCCQAFVPEPLLPVSLWLVLELGAERKTLLGTPTPQAQLRAAQSIEEAKSHVLRMKVGGQPPSMLGPPCWPLRWPRQHAASSVECAGAWLRQQWHARKAAARLHAAAHAG